MLMDYITEPQPRRSQPEGVQIAGLMDFLELAARMGQKFAPEAVDEMRAYAKTDPLGFYRSNNLFIDPRGDLTLNSGVTYAGRTLPKRGSEEQLRKSSAQAVNLATYLNDTQIGDMLRTDFDKINVGRGPVEGNFKAKFSEPTASERGLLMINENIPKDEIPQLFEHELQHAIQFAQKKPQGTNPDAMDNDFMDYLIAEQGLEPSVVTGLDTLARQYGIIPNDLRYYATRGEAEARAAEGIANQVATTGRPLDAPPPTRFYTTLPRHMPVTGFDARLMYDIPQGIYPEYLAYRRQKLTGAGTP
jgi:hypothetical protein